MASADFSSISRILPQVNANLTATDIELDFLGTTTTEVAEPETLPILGPARRRLR